MYIIFSYFVTDFYFHIIQFYICVITCFIFSLYVQNSYYKKNICILMIQFFLLHKNFIIWFLHAVRLVKSSLHFVYKIL